MAWVVVEAVAERQGEERTFYNVAPDRGPRHDMHPHCWCEPAIDDECDSLVIHRESH